MTSTVQISSVANMCGVLTRAQYISVADTYPATRSAAQYGEQYPRSPSADLPLPVINDTDVADGKAVGQAGAHNVSVSGLYHICTTTTMHLYKHSKYVPTYVRHACMAMAMAMRV
jgi:hypothetical protein